jgi:hypothetical protein
VLNGYRGIVVADGYGAYDALVRAGPGFTLAHCWAHVRRKFVEAEPHYPGPCGEVLDLIGQRYAVERAGPGVDPAASEETRTAALALRARRREQSSAIVEAIRGWAHQQRALPESSLGKAIAYMLGLWAGLTRFLDDPRIPRDNNATERGLRAMVLGRKKSLRVALQARDRGRGPLLQPDRVGEALRGRAEGLPAPRDARRPRESRHRHFSSRALDRLTRGRSQIHRPGRRGET